MRDLIRAALLCAMLAAVSFAGSSTTEDSPLTTPCSGTDLKGFVCNIKETLLYIGPMISVIALVLGGILYISAQIFVSAESRGRYQNVATSLIIGAIVLAALVGGAVSIYEATKGLLVSSS